LFKIVFWKKIQTFGDFPQKINKFTTFVLKSSENQHFLIFFLEFDTFIYKKMQILGLLIQLTQL